MRNHAAVREIEETRMREEISEEYSRTREERTRAREARKRRVMATKILTIIMLAIFIIIPLVCCGIFFVKIQDLNQSLQETIGRLEEINHLLTEQQKLWSECWEEAASQNVTAESVDAYMQEDALVDGEDEPEIIEFIRNEAEHKVYLTFDDGPSEYTHQILDILDRYDVKATFFVVGKENETSQETLREIVDRGHSLGMHSFSHKYGEIYESVESFEADLLKIQDYLYETTGVTSTIYRFPGGSSNKVSEIEMLQFIECLQEHGITFYDWNISSGDGGSTVLSVEELTHNVTKDITQWDTSVVLMHDSADKQTTVEALPVIIENILAMEDTVILPITEDTKPVQHIK